MIDELEEMLKTAVGGVCQTMLNFDPRPIPLQKNAITSDAHLASSVGFIGKVTGVVYIYATADFARDITRTMTGLSDAEIDSDEIMVNDAMGEVANMVVGNLKATLVDCGMACVLTIPSIVRGSNFSIEAISSTTRRVLCFRCKDSHNLVVEILIKPEEPTE
jgi:chemotaxis protein CheX